jgi:hypothetical protein
VAGSLAGATHEVPIVPDQREPALWGRSSPASTTLRSWTRRCSWRRRRRSRGTWWAPSPRTGAPGARPGLTSPDCPAGPQILHDIQAVRPIEGVKDVDIEIVWEPYWSPEKVEPKIRAMMGF